MYRIQLDNTFFEGQNNAYLFDGGGPTTLVDPGIAHADTRDQLVDGLADRGLALEDVEKVVVTHFHSDHAGLAGEIQAESGATVRAHAADAPLVAGEEDAEASMTERRQQYFEDWGMPEQSRAALRRIHERSEPLSGPSCDVDAFEDGDVVRAGGEELVVVHLPGHTAGLCGFVRESKAGQQLLSGDALLPEYTPNVGGADVRVENPLASYLSTLDRIAAASFERAWPGHRDPIADPASRARDILAHHYERTERVLDVLDEHGPADAWTVSAHLFGDLEDIHILHGPGEAYAHLDHLDDHGLVDRTSDGYVTTDGGPPVRSLFPQGVGDSA